MNVFLIYAHPEPRSFNGALKDLAVEVLTQAGHTVRVSDLYQMKFKAVADQDDFTVLTNPDHFSYAREQHAAVIQQTFSPDIVEEQEKVDWADFLLFQYPLWWTDPPAIVKGWFDRVFAKGFAYGNGRHYEQGLLKGKRAMLTITTGGGPEDYGETLMKGTLRERLFNVQHEKLFYCGIDVLEPFMAWGPEWIGEKGRQDVLVAYKDRLLQIPTAQGMFFTSGVGSV